MLIPFLFQRDLFIGSAHIVQKDWQQVWMLSCLGSDPLAQAGVSRNGQDKQNRPESGLKIVNETKTYLC